MELSLSGRKVVITGSGDGIGRALALEFARQGARVAVCARSQERISVLSEELEGSGHVCMRADLTSRDDLEAFHKAVMESFSGLDVLVNNVGGILKLATFFDLDDDDWDRSFQLNLLPAVRLIRLFTPTLKHSVAPRIINISSTAAIKPGDIFPHYSAMKAGLSNLTGSLARVLAPDKICVNAVSPGPVWSQSWENEAQSAAEQSGKGLQEMRNRIQEYTSQTVPLKRMGVPEDVTGLVLLLASDQAAWITGTNFTVDGGILQNTL